MSSLGKRRLKDLPLMAASLGIAFVIWLLAQQGKLQTDRLEAPVEIVNLPANVEIAIDPQRIPIIVKFPLSQRSGVIAQNFAIQLDAGEVFGADPRVWAGLERFNDKTVDVTLDHVLSLGLPQSVKVSGFGGQSRVHLQSKLRTLKLAVKPQTSGYPPPGFELSSSLKAEPSEVLVTGSPDALQTLGRTSSEIVTKPVSLDGRTTSFRAATALDVPPDVELVNAEVARNITLTISIAEKESVKSIGNVPIKILVYNDKLQAAVEPATVEIRVSGKLSALEQIDASAFTFALRGTVPEEAGQSKEADLVVDLSEKLSRDTREKVKVEDWSPKRITIRYTQK